MTIVTTVVAKCDVCEGTAPASADPYMHTASRHPADWIAVGTVEGDSSVLCSWTCAAVYVAKRAESEKERTLKEQFDSVRTWYEAKTKPSDPRLYITHGTPGGAQYKHPKGDHCDVCVNQALQDERKRAEAERIGVALGGAYCGWEADDEPGRRCHLPSGHFGDHSEFPRGGAVPIKAYR